jgi:hypothetical protein
MRRPLLRWQFFAFVFASVGLNLAELYILGMLAVVLAVYTVAMLLDECQADIDKAYSNGAPAWRCLRLAITGRTGPYHYRRRIDR